MAGEAKTQAFSIGTATVMLGPLANLWTLNPDDHGIGLVKDFAVTAEPTYTELRQGVKNTLVYSILTQNDVRASCSVYEYTGKNLRYSLGVSPGSFVTRDLVLHENIAAGVSFKVKAVDLTDTSTGDIATDLATAGLKVGGYVYFHDTGGNRDKIHLGKVATVTGVAYVSGGSPVDAHAVVTVTAGTTIPSALAGTPKVGTIDKFEAGVKTEQEFYSMKVVGILPEGSTPIVLLIPKVRVIRGFNLNFSTDDFQSMPFEFGLFEPVSGDNTVGDMPNGGVMSVFRP